MGIPGGRAANTAPPASVFLVRARCSLHILNGKGAAVKGGKAEDAQIPGEGFLQPTLTAEFSVTGSITCSEGEISSRPTGHKGTGQFGSYHTVFKGEEGTTWRGQGLMVNDARYFANLLDCI